MHVRMKIPWISFVFGHVSILQKRQVGQFQGRQGKQTQCLQNRQPQQLQWFHCRKHFDRDAGLSHKQWCPQDQMFRAERRNNIMLKVKQTMFLLFQNTNYRVKADLFKQT